MKGIFYIHLIGVAGTIGLTIWMPFSIILGTFESKHMIIIPACWLIMLKYNPVWADLWEKWSNK
jgi:hypothetical protein